MALASVDYDSFWERWTDFNRFHPGARHRRRLIIEEVRRLVSREPLESVADMGCGSAELVLLLRRFFPQIKQWSGGDYSPQVIEKNKNEIQNIDFFVVDLDSPSNLTVGPFDCVICSEVIEHLDHRAVAFGNLAAMIRTGGYLIVTCPAGRVFATERHFGHVSHPNMMEIEELAASSGLEVLFSKNWGFPFYTLLKWVTNVRPEWSIRHFASGKYSWIQKWISLLLYWLNFLNLSRCDFGCQRVVVLRKKNLS